MTDDFLARTIDTTWGLWYKTPSSAVKTYLEVHLASLLVTQAARAKQSVVEKKGS